MKEIRKIMNSELYIDGYNLISNLCPEKIQSIKIYFMKKKY